MRQKLIPKQRTLLLDSLQVVTSVKERNVVPGATTPVLSRLRARVKASIKVRSNPGFVICKAKFACHEVGHATGFDSLRVFGHCSSAEGIIVVDTPPTHTKSVVLYLPVVRGNAVTRNDPSACSIQTLLFSRIEAYAMRLIQRFINKHTELSKRFYAVPTPCKHIVERTA